MMRKFVKSVFYALQRIIPRRKGCLVLGYHSVDAHDDPYTVSVEEMDWQISEIQRQGLRVISLRELEKMMDEKRVEDRTVVLTFDDGREDNYANLFPLLKKHNIPATIFSITGFIGKVRPSSVRPNPMLTAEEMHEMQKSGLVDFQPHTVSHPKLTKVSLEQVEKEVRESKRELEQMFDKSCAYFAYPYGRLSADIKKVLERCGIRLACSGLRGFVTFGTDRLALPRSEVRRTTSRSEFKSIIHRGSLR